MSVDRLSDIGGRFGLLPLRSLKRPASKPLASPPKALSLGDFPDGFMVLPSVAFASHASRPVRRLRLSSAEKPDTRRALAAWLRMSGPYALSEV